MEGKQTEKKIYSHHKKAEKLNEPEDTVNNQHELYSFFFSGLSEIQSKITFNIYFPFPAHFYVLKGETESEQCKCSTMIIKK